MDLPAYELHSEIRTFRNDEKIPSMIQTNREHPGAEGVEYSFFPALENSSLFIRLASDRKIGIRINLGLQFLEMSLPSSSDEAVLQLVLPDDTSLHSVSLSGGTEFFTGFKDSIPYDMTLLAAQPENLVVTLPDPGAMNKEIQVSLISSDSVFLSPVGSSGGYILMPSPVEQTFQFSYPSRSKRSWTVSPLEYLESFRYELKIPEEFPAPRPRDLDQILSFPVSDWRNENFEIYSWTSFPEVLVWDCLNYNVQDRFFTRLSYFVEKKGYNGTLMSNDELKGKHGWNAHDYRPSDLALFYNTARESDFTLNPEEELMRTILISRGMLTLQDDGTLIPESGAVISISRESSPLFRQRFLTHEASHGLYFTSAEYRTFVKKLWESLDEDDRIMWRFFLGWYGYDPENEDLMINEFQAYLVQQSCEAAPEYFGIRMRNLLASYPEQKKYLNRGTGAESASFQTWSEQIEDWIYEKWSLKAGNFSLLRKELP